MVATSPFPRATSHKTATCSLMFLVCCLLFFCAWWCCVAPLLSQVVVEFRVPLPLTVDEFHMYVTCYWLGKCRVDKRPPPGLRGHATPRCKERVLML